MIRKLLLLASFPIMAAPLISSVATPAAAASLYGEQGGVSQLESTSFKSNSVLIADNDYDRDRRRAQELRRDIRQNARELRELRNRNNDRYRDRNYDRDYRYRNYDPYNRNRVNYDPYNRNRVNYDPYYPYRNYPYYRY